MSNSQGLFLGTVGSQCGSVKVAVTKAGTKGSATAGSVQDRQYSHLLLSLKAILASVAVAKGSTRICCYR